MKPLYTQEQFNSSKSMDSLTCQCYYCDKPFNTIKKRISHELKYNRGRVKFCSQECNKLLNNPPNIVECKNCNCLFKKIISNVMSTKNNFCSHSCSASYNNKNKKTGNRRSKLEIWLESQLITLYPNLLIDFNKKSAIMSELDIYIPSLNLAFELNGIFHYEPIYGVDKLEQIKSNDKSKSLACHEAKIDLCIIDTSAQKYVKPSTSQKYLNIIVDIINERIS